MADGWWLIEKEMNHKEHEEHEEKKFWVLSFEFWGGMSPNNVYYILFSNKNWNFVEILRK